MTWSSTDNGVDQKGLYTAPSGKDNTTQTITVTSNAVPSKTATATIHVTDGNPDASLLARWVFEEGSGTSALDASGHGFTGTLLDGPVWAEGRIGQGQALQFTASNSRMEVQDNYQLNPQSLSLALWVYLPQDPAGSWRSILHKGDVYGTATGYDVILEENRGIAWDTGTGSSDRWWPQGVSIPIGRWTHLVLTYDAGTGLKQAFQDGALKDAKLGTTPAPLATNSSPLVLDYLSANGSGHFDGSLDDLRIYGRTLAESEVAEAFLPVRLQPQVLSLQPGGTATFTAISSVPLAGGSITWGCSAGMIDGDGKYTAPAQPGTYVVTATNSLHPSRPDVATVTVREFDAADDFSATQNPAGAWSYGWSISLGSPFTPFFNHWLASNGLQGWDVSSVPVIAHNPTQNSITSGNATWVPNQLTLHPGPAGEYAVLRWTAAEACLLDVSAAWMGADRSPTTTDVHLLLNGGSRFDGTVNAYHQGPSYQGTLAVQAGDTLDVAVGFGNGNYFSDTTAVQFRISKSVPSLTVLPGSALLAPGAAQSFIAAGSGGPVVWSVEEGPGGGIVTAGGLYSAPGVPGVYHVVATSAANPSLVLKATVVVGEGGTK